MVEKQKHLKVLAPNQEQPFLEIVSLQSNWQIWIAYNMAWNNYKENKKLQQKRWSAWRLQKLKKKDSINRKIWKMLK